MNQSGVVLKPVRIAEASFQYAYDVGVFCCGCYSFLVVDLFVDFELFHVGARGNEDCDLHVEREGADKFNFDHQSDYLGH
jgi:hypothetical protein